MTSILDGMDGDLSPVLVRVSPCKIELRTETQVRLIVTSKAALDAYEAHVRENGYTDVYPRGGLGINYISGWQARNKADEEVCDG